MFYKINGLMFCTDKIPFKGNTRYYPRYCINAKCKKKKYLQMHYGCRVNSIMKPRWLKRKDNLLICTEIKETGPMQYTWAKHKMCNSCYYKFLRPKTYPSFKITRAA